MPFCSMSGRHILYCVIWSGDRDRYRLYTSGAMNVPVTPPVNQVNNDRNQTYQNKRTKYRANYDKSCIFVAVSRAVAFL